ncbi:PQQ-like beta-propeller repeat protein [Natronomonas salina]|uniref:PQQ-like beta-propeller repeat protein n=1 Tax=Natronomonas salina TaxID=1710540 RepID=UPI0015B50B2F|nr:PQQ-like beta-propeller repeat protein [Natronomonas salina]QLD89841.1 PQQ-like beta-propeller repeat protein [Natronomonas salina]
MSRTARRVPLGDVNPCGSRQAGRRSGVTTTDDGPVVGLADGRVRAFDPEGTERWTADGEGSAITLVPFGDGVIVGERSARGAIRYLEAGEERWRHDATDAIGEPTKDTRFFLPMVVDASVDGDTAYVAARRYERRGDQRHFESTVYALAPDGTVRWRHAADASPIAVVPFESGAADRREATERESGDGGTASGVAVAYNRCPGDHDDGLVVLDGDGRERWTWDPDRGAQRRVGDVAATAEGLVVASHADYRGYRLTDGAVDWAVDLGIALDRGDRVYAYPNHVHATDSGVAFLTGNSFPEEGRETDERHPDEQSAFGYSLNGEERWRAEVGGFAHEIDADGDRLLVPVAQHFRDRDPVVHGWRLFDVADGLVETIDCEGVVTAAGLDGNRLALVEEPVRYHDDGEVRGGYALHLP